MGGEEQEREDLQRQTLRLEGDNDGRDGVDEIKDVPGDLETAHFSFIVNSITRPCLGSQKKLYAVKINNKLKKHSAQDLGTQRFHLFLLRWEEERLVNVPKRRVNQQGKHTPHQVGEYNHAQTSHDGVDMREVLVRSLRIAKYKEKLFVN